MGNGVAYNLSVLERLAQGHAGRCEKEKAALRYRDFF